MTILLSDFTVPNNNYWYSKLVVKTMGRPPSLVLPCRFYQKQFKRQEHLQRYDRMIRINIMLKTDSFL